MSNPNPTDTNKSADEGKKLLIKLGLCWGAFVLFCAVLYGVYAGLATYSVMTSPVVNAAAGAAVVQALIAGFFGTIAAIFIGTVGSIVIGVFLAVFIAIFFGGKKDGKGSASTGSDPTDKSSS